MCESTRRALCGLLCVLLGATAVPCFAQGESARAVPARVAVVAPPLSERSAAPVSLPRQQQKLGAELAELLDLLEHHSSVETYREQLGPTLRVTHQLAAYRFRLVPRDRVPLELRASLGLGATTVRFDRAGGLLRTPLAQSESQVALRGGVALAYRLGSAIDLFAGYQSYFDIAGADDGTLTDGMTGPVELRDVAWWRFPIQWGFQVRLP